MKRLSVVLAAVGLIAASGIAVGNTDIILKARVGGTGTASSGPIPLDAASVGKTVTVEIWARNPNGVCGVAGDIVPAGTAGVFSSPAQGATWKVKSFAVPLYVPDGSGQLTGQSVTVYDPSGGFAGETLPMADIQSSDGIYNDTWGGYAWYDNALVSAHAPVQTVVTPTLIYATGFNIGGVPQPNGGMSLLGSSQTPHPLYVNSFGADEGGAMVASYTFTVLTPGNLTLTWVDSGKSKATQYGGYFTCGIPLNDNDVGSITNLVFTPEPASAALFCLSSLLLARRRHSQEDR